MGHPTPEKIAAIMFGEHPVYGLDADSRIRECANRMTARALFEALKRMDDEDPEFPAQLESILSTMPFAETTFIIGFDTGEVPTADEAPSTPAAADPQEFYLKLVFRDESAAYYQFPLFPDLSASYVNGASRKRAGTVQHLHISLNGPEALQHFIQSCRTNPHFLRVEESTAQEFHNAPSNAI